MPRDDTAIDGPGDLVTIAFRAPRACRDAARAVAKRDVPDLLYTDAGEVIRIAALHGLHRIYNDVWTALASHELIVSEGGSRRA